MINIFNFLTAAVLAACPLLYGTLGESLTERSGNLNLGVEGMMFMGGVAGLAGSYYYEQAVQTPVAWVSVLIALICAFLAAAFGGLIFSVLTVTLRANQNVTDWP
jgi:simple sugar transport system permease protein